jgi:hypothetical protein
MPGLNGAFSSGCYAHCLTLDDYEWDKLALTNNATFDKTFQQFIASPNFAVRNIESCTTWDCSQGCPNGALAKEIERMKQD